MRSSIQPLSVSHKSRSLRPPRLDSAPASRGDSSLEAIKSEKEVTWSWLTTIP